MSYVAGTAWAPENSDFRETLTIDLGEIKNVTRIATRGRSHSQGFVKEYTISFGFNGLDYALFKENDGNAKVCFMLFNFIEIYVSLSLIVILV